MNRVRRLFQEMWWLIAAIVIATVAMVYYVHPFFLVYVPIALVFFTYFAVVRYDEEGRDREM